jgi:demethylspheroidene O-methyltransferase
MSATVVPLADPALSLADRLQSWRDRLIGSPRFRRWAASFPLTRPIARARTRALFDLCAGFVYAQVLAAAVELRLFEILAEGPLAIETLAGRLALPPDSARLLVEAAESLRLVRRRGQRYGLGDLGAALVDNPGLVAMILHHRTLYTDLADPVSLLRGARDETGLSAYWPYARSADPAGLSAAETAPYTALMSASQTLIAEEVLDAYPFRRHESLVDIGGGDGTFLAAVAARVPTLRLTLFDLPPVAAAARARFDAAGLGSRATAVGGDFRRDSLPQGADIATLVRVLHDHDDDRALDLLRAIHAALPAGGTLLVAEPMAGTPDAQPSGAAYFGFYLMAMRSGRPRTAQSIMALLNAAGFRDARLLATHTPLLVRMIAACA